MATRQSTADYVVDQLHGLPEVAAKKMFGEYALYASGKVVGLICDNTLFIKITDAGREFVGPSYQEGTPYPGARPAMTIDEGRIDDSRWLSELVRITAGSLPPPKKRAARATSRKR